MSGAIRWRWLSPVIGCDGGASGTGSLPGSGSVIETSKTGHGAEEDLLLAGLLAVLVALLDGDGGEDVDRLLALADAAVEVEEGAEAGDVGRGDPAGVALDRDQHLVPEAVAREAVAGADADPALPAVGGQQRAGGLLDPLAVGLAARVALVVGERRRLKRRAIVVLLSGLGPAPLAGRSPATRTPARACHPRVAGRPAGGRSRLRGVVEVRVELVVDRAVGGLGLDRLALGALLLARRGLGLVVGGVGALDGLLELASATRGRAGRRAS